jgi:hypothetical protein
MKDPNGKKINNKDDEMQRYKDFFNSFNEASETDEVLHQLANLNFGEEKTKFNKNINNEGNISKIKFENYNNNNNEINKEEKPISIVLLKEKINRICISLQGLNFKEKELKNLTDFIPCLNNFEQRKFPQIDKLLDVFINLISRIKEEANVKNKFIQKLNEVSFDIENYEKKNIINQRVIKDKENEIVLLMNKLNAEKEKSQDKSKSVFLELNSLKKENQELTDTILIYKNKLRKVEAELQVINEKYKNNPANENKIRKSLSNEEDNSENGLNNSKIIDNKYFSIKKLNMSLIYLLKEINKMIVKYDSLLINLLTKKINLDKVTDLNCNIETNLLLDDANMKIFRKSFLYNMERIYKKIEILQKGNMDSREIKSNINLNNNVNNNDKGNLSNNNGSGSNSKEKHFKNNISPKWYDNYNNKKIGYVFDKEKVITCEDDDNGAK